MIPPSISTKVANYHLEQLKLVLGMLYLFSCGKWCFDNMLKIVIIACVMFWQHLIENCITIIKPKGSHCFTLELNSRTWKWWWWGNPSHPHPHPPHPLTPPPPTPHPHPPFSMYYFLVPSYTFMNLLHFLLGSVSTKRFLSRPFIIRYVICQEELIYVLIYPFSLSFSSNSYMCLKCCFEDIHWRSSFSILEHIPCTYLH